MWETKYYYNTMVKWYPTKAFRVSIVWVKTAVHKLQFIFNSHDLRISTKHKNNIFIFMCIVFDDLPMNKKRQEYYPHSFPLLRVDFESRQGLY